VVALLLAGFFIWRFLRRRSVFPTPQLDEPQDPQLLGACDDGTLDSDPYADKGVLPPAVSTVPPTAPRDTATPTTAMSEPKPVPLIMRADEPQVGTRSTDASADPQHLRVPADTTTPRAFHAHAGKDAAPPESTTHALATDAPPLVPSSGRPPPQHTGTGTLSQPLVPAPADATRPGSVQAASTNELMQALLARLHDVSTASPPPYDLTSAHDTNV